MATSTEFLQTQILHLDSIFQKACNQVLLLNNFLRQLQIRYDRASRDNLRTYRYALRLRLCTVEGLRNTLYEYATQQASKIEKMEDEMRKMGQEPMVLYDLVAEESDDVDSDWMGEHMIGKNKRPLSWPVYITRRVKHVGWYCWQIKELFWFNLDK